MVANFVLFYFGRYELEKWQKSICGENIISRPILMVHNCAQIERSAEE